MGQYCCCGQKIRKDWVCKCKWYGWIDLRKEDKLPEKDGIYKVRYFTNGGDFFEGMMRFTRDPIRYENDGKCAIHWDSSHYDDNVVYAWKYLI